ncbi:MAG TPA: response regulator [Minicystis sp.]|nr:response regulator [Minicystis sp.]
MAAPATVLVVDDDADLRESVAAALSDAGYDVREAESGQRAIESVARAAPSVILLDLMMPDGNGWEVLERLRARVPGAHIPVIVMSAYASAAPAGARSLLRKPIHRDELLSAVESYLRAA